MNMSLLLLTQNEIFSWTSPWNQHQILQASTAEFHADVPLERLRKKQQIEQEKVKDKPKVKSTVTNAQNKSHRKTQKITHSS